MPLSNRDRKRLAGTMLLIASTVLLATAACGGGDSDSDSNQAASDGQNSRSAYTECMSKNGVTLNLPSEGASGWPEARGSGRPTDFPTVRPSGGRMRGGFGRPAGVDDATWEKAQKACESVRPSFGPGGGQQNGAFTAYRNCLRDHGVTLDDGAQDLNTADPKTAAALKACEALRPSAAPAPAATS